MSIRNNLINLFRLLDDAIYEHTEIVRILFVVTDGYGFSCQYPVIKELQECADVRVHITLDRRDRLGQIAFGNALAEKLFEQFYIDPKKAVFKKWHLIVDTHVNGFFSKRNALRVYMHHGPGFGIQGTKMAIVDNHDIFFGLSNFERTMFEKIKPDVFSNDKAFFPIGFPKDDVILGNSYDRDTLLKNLGLKDRPTILITSHWQDVSILRTFGSDIFRTLANAMPDYNIIQTGHPWLWQPNKKLSAEWCDTVTSECLEIEDNHENALFLPDMSVEPLLFIADLLVADHSSVMTTYALLDRPIAFFDNPDLDFAIKQVYELYLDASSPFRNLEQLVDVCERAINNPDDKKMGRKTMRESFHSNYGMAGKAAADILRSIGCICSTNSKKWKTVMIMSDLLSH